MTPKRLSWTKVRFQQMSKYELRSDGKHLILKETITTANSSRKMLSRYWGMASSRLLNLHYGDFVVVLNFYYIRIFVRSAGDTTPYLLLEYRFLFPLWIMVDIMANS